MVSVTGDAVRQKDVADLLGRVTVACQLIAGLMTHAVMPTAHQGMDMSATEIKMGQIALARVRIGMTAIVAGAVMKETAV